MQEEKVSVIVPIYNSEKYLKVCVDSILKQTYSNLQIILINDGSTDQSWNICKEVQKKDKRIIIKTQSNSGVSAARNKGISIANGSWIMFVDPDDVLDVNIINILMSKVNTNLDIISCACYGFTSKEDKRVNHFFNGNRLFTFNKNDLYLQLLNPEYGQKGPVDTAIGVPWGKLYRTSFIKDNNLKFDLKLRRMQDNLFNMYAFYYARNIYYIDKPLYFYRLNNITNYVQKHRNDLQKIFEPVVRARMDCINKLDLKSNSKIYEFYLKETAVVYFGILNNILMVNNNSVKLDIANQLKLRPYFGCLFERKNLNKIKDKKIKIKLFLIRHNMYKSYLILYKLSKLGKN